MKDEFHKKLIQSLQVYAFDPKQKGSIPSSEYEQTYQLWKEVWEDALQNEMNIKKPLRSDNFLRQDAIVSLFKGDECIGLFSSNKFNLSSCADLDDSYFVDWNPSLLNDIKAGSEIVITFENFTLSRAYRGSKSSIPWKELVVLLGLQRQLENNFPHMIATPRKNKSVHIVGMRAGAKTLASDIPYKIDGEIVDLILWDKDSPTRVWDSDIYNLSQSLWRKRKEELGNNETELNKPKNGGTYAA